MRAALVVHVLGALGALLVAGVSRAAEWETCNGCPVKWRGTLSIHRNSCSIPDTGNINTSYWNGVKQWDDLTSEVDNFMVRPVSDCSFDANDGMNEIFLADREDELDGNNGVTFYSAGACFLGCNDIDEADIGIANDLPFTDPSAVSLANEGRGTFVHEFGHLFGFLDENDGHGAMHQTPRPYVGGSASATVWGNDTTGLNTVYGLNSSLPNLLPSAYQISGTTISLLETGTVTVCRGTSRNIRFRLTNSGKGSSGTYQLNIWLRTNSGGSGGAQVATFTHSLGAFSFWSGTLSFNIPSNLPYGTYYIFVKMDHTSSISEVREGDNLTRSGQRLNVNCG
jgi:hypothetical protein